MKFWEKNLRTDRFRKQAFLVRHFASFSCKQVKVSWLARLGQNFDEYPCF